MRWATSSLEKPTRTEEVVETESLSSLVERARSAIRCARQDGTTGHFSAEIKANVDLGKDLAGKRLLHEVIVWQAVPFRGDDFNYGFIERFYVDVSPAMEMKAPVGKWWTEAFLPDKNEK